LNTHFDHVGTTARLESAGRLLQAISRIGPADGTVVTGDFNCTEKDPPYRRLVAEEKGKPRLQDARLVSLRPPYGPSFSYNGFKPGGADGERIDHIFVGPGMSVAGYGILSDLWGDRFASDHFAVLAEIRLRRR
jgi:endonuclease/exonuclease/phosphatase family metal-dependent hydrolase